MRYLFALHGYTNNYPLKERLIVRNETSSRLNSVVYACVCFIMCFAATAKDTSVSIPPSIDKLLAVISARIAVADRVALTKWDNQRPVSDEQRESEVIAEAARLAPKYGLETTDVAAFFRAQIEANKWVQYQDLNRWQLYGNVPQTHRPDLAQLRNKLDALQDTILQRLAASRQSREMSNCRITTAHAVASYARRAHLDALHHKALVRAMGDFCHG